MPTILVVGKTQQGKSSLTKSLTGINSIQCGVYGQGRSTTSTIKLYHSLHHFKGSVFIDCIGTMGNDLISPDVIRDSIEALLLQHNISHIDGIIYVESYMEGATNVPLFVQDLSILLGTFPASSVMVVLTKENERSQTFLVARRKAITQQIQKYGIDKSNMMDFLTPYQDFQVPDARMRAQLQIMDTILHRLTKLSLTTLQDKKDKIKILANQIRQRTKRQEMVDNFVEVPRTITKYVSVPYVQQYVECYGFLGLKRRIIQRTHYKNVESQEVVVDKVNKPVNRTIYKKMSECLSMAKTQYLRQIRENLII